MQSRMIYPQATTTPFDASAAPRTRQTPRAPAPDNQRPAGHASATAPPETEAHQPRTPAPKASGESAPRPFRPKSPVSDRSGGFLPGVHKPLSGDSLRNARPA